MDLIQATRKSVRIMYYCSLPRKRPCTTFQGATAAASIQTYGILISGKRPCGPKSRVKFKRPWALTRDNTVNLHMHMTWHFMLCALFILFYSYYRHVLVYVPGGASMLALIGLSCLMAITYWRSRKFKGNFTTRLATHIQLLIFHTLHANIVAAYYK